MSKMIGSISNILFQIAQAIVLLFFTRHSILLQFSMFGHQIWSVVEVV